MKKEKKDVLLLLTDRWADWEASYAIAGINSVEQYTVKTIAIDLRSKVSIGGLYTKIDYSIEDYKNFDNLAMLILPGGFSWGENPYNEIADFVEKVKNLEVPIAAICGATIFLGKHGFLDDIKHTGDEFEYFQKALSNEKGYKGREHFVTEQVVIDKGFITANETAAIDFAYEIFCTLRIDTNEELDLWRNKFKYGLLRMTT